LPLELGYCPFPALLDYEATIIKGYKTEMKLIVCACYLDIYSLRYFTLKLFILIPLKYFS
jgi:hypothetical protein